MKILAIDSSGLVASIAILEDNILVAEYTLNYKMTHSQTLLPMLSAVSEMIKLDLESIDAIAVASGPGSFTGLRIGSATAKGLAQGIDKPIISVPTLEGLAYQMYGYKQWICPIMDARRGEVYTGIYEFTNQSGQIKLTRIMEQGAIELSSLLVFLQKEEKEVVFLGDGVDVYEQQIKDTLSIPYTFAPIHKAKQSAAAVAVLAKELYMDGCYQKAKDHSPIYLRASQAERERLENIKNKG